MLECIVVCDVCRAGLLRSQLPRVAAFNLPMGMPCPKPHIPRPCAHPRTHHPPNQHHPHLGKVLMVLPRHCRPHKRATRHAKRGLGAMCLMYIFITRLPWAPTPPSLPSSFGANISPRSPFFGICPCRHMASLCLYRTFFTSCQRAAFLPALRWAVRAQPPPANLLGAHYSLSWLAMPSKRLLPRFLVAYLSHPPSPTH